MDVKFRKIKEELRVLGIDDAPFKFKGKRKVLLIGTVFRAGKWLDGVLSTKIEIDGLDSTEKIIEMVKRTRHREQLRVIVFDGITFGGMNIVDIKKLYKETGLPVIVVNRKSPDLKAVKNAISKFPDSEKRLSLIKKAGKIHSIKIKEHNLYIQSAGITLKDSYEILKISSTRSHIPEALRAAHLIARGVTWGESKGKA